VPRQTDSGPFSAARPIDSNVLTFVSRAEQLRQRGHRNYGRWKMLTKGFVAADGPERRQWEKEGADESRRDVAWNRRHGPVRGRASVLAFSVERSGNGIQGVRRFAGEVLTGVRD